MQNGKEYIRKLINIAYLSIGVPLLFFIYVYLESTAETLMPMLDPVYSIAVFIGVFVVSLALIVLGQRKYKSGLLEAHKSNLLYNKLLAYQKGTTMRFVAYSIAASLISIAFYLTDFQPFAAVFGIMIVLFSINNPNARKLVRDLQLKDEQKKIMLEGLDYSDE